MGTRRLVRPVASLRAVFLLLLTVWVMTLQGCATLDEPELLIVSDVAPSRIELGDRISVLGDNFVEGRPVTIELWGTLHRSGQRDPEPYRKQFSARSEAKNLISFAPREAELSELVKTVDGAQHTTFRGSIRVSFEAKSGPAVYGTLESAVLDFFPATEADDAALERTREGRRLLTFLGVKIDEATFAIQSLEPEGRAARAGLLVGDRLIAFAGVNLVKLEDLAYAGTDSTAVAEFRRGRLKDPARADVAVAGFKPRAAEELVGAAVLVGVAVALLLFFFAPVARLMSWFERKLLQRLAQRGPTRRIQGPSLGDVAFGRDLLPRGLWGALFRPAPYIVFLMVSVAVTLLSLGQPLLVAELDLAILFVLSGTGCMTTALLLGGWGRERGRWSLLRGARAAVSALLFQLPALCSLACVFLRHGSLGPVEVVRAQGALPWTWTAFDSPIMLLCFVLLFSTVLPESSRGGARLAEHTTGIRMRWDHRFSRYVTFVAEWGHVWVVSAVAAIVFLGGWNLPGADASRSVDWPTLLAGAALLELKTWGLVALVMALRWAALRAALSDLLGVWFRYLLPLSVSSLVLTLVFARLPLEQALPTQAQGAVSLAVFSVVVTIFGLFVLRVAKGLRGGVAPASSLNPWL